MQMKVTVYDYDLYDMVDISQLKEGNTIVEVSLKKNLSKLLFPLSTTY